MVFAGGVWIQVQRKILFSEWQLGLNRDRDGFIFRAPDADVLSEHGIIGPKEENADATMILAWMKGDWGA